jgi:hypothetical protein
MDIVVEGPGNRAFFIACDVKNFRYRKINIASVLIDAQSQREIQYGRNVRHSRKPRNMRTMPDEFWGVLR